MSEKGIMKTTDWNDYIRSKRKKENPGTSYLTHFSVNHLQVLHKMEPKNGNNKETPDINLTTKFVYL